ncbi:MAG: hypothetical protein KGJ02_02705 [Verrucomicrobiota bacterium]|nr:hypothetical protein [Verrucomicrobiota bacterium]
MMFPSTNSSLPPLNCGDVIQPPDFQSTTERPVDLPPLSPRITQTYDQSISLVRSTLSQLENRSSVRRESSDFPVQVLPDSDDPNVAIDAFYKELANSQNLDYQPEPDQPFVGSPRMARLGPSRRSESPQMGDPIASSGEHCAIEEMSITALQENDSPLHMISPRSFPQAQQTEPRVYRQITPSYKRFFLCRFADKVGYIPVIGVAVGVVRIVVSLAVKIIAELGRLFFACLSCRFLKNQCQYLSLRAGAEMKRGFFELLPNCKLKRDIHQRDLIRNFYPRITDKTGAWGTYMHENPDGSLTYSNFSPIGFDEND